MFYESVGPNPTMTHHEITVFRHRSLMWEQYWAPNPEQESVPYIMGLAKKQRSDPYTTFLNLYLPHKFRRTGTEEVLRLINTCGASSGQGWRTYRARRLQRPECGVDKKQWWSRAV